jgi:hypothetical protein
MHVCVRLFCVYVVLCVGSDLATGCPLVQGDLPSVYGIKKLKKSGRGSKGCRAVYIYFMCTNRNLLTEVIAIESRICRMLSIRDSSAFALLRFFKNSWLKPVVFEDCVRAIVTIADSTRYIPILCSNCPSDSLVVSTGTSLVFGTSWFWFHPPSLILKWKENM